MRIAKAAAMLALLAPIVGAQPALLLVAPRTLHEALGEYLAHKRTQLPAELVALETALADAEGADDAERLKRWLFARWRAPGDAPLRYVLLVGGDLLPVRFMVLDRVHAPAFDYAFYPSDLYYADVAEEDGTFESWNAAADDFHARYFGEVRGERDKDGPIDHDRIHYLPELAVGRWPVATPEEVRAVTAKSIAFERRVQERPPRGTRSSSSTSPTTGATTARRRPTRPTCWRRSRPARRSPFTPVTARPTAGTAA